MTNNTLEYLYALLGGLTIGLSVTIMLLFKGRITGISGIIYNLLTFKKGDWSWRGAFLLGLIVGGGILAQIYPSSLSNTLGYSYPKIALAGLLVGFGTLLGNGCTSGHAVCGVSRFSLRSILATCTFMASGFSIVYFLGAK